MISLNNHHSLTCFFNSFFLEWNEVERSKEKFILDLKNGEKLLKFIVQLVQSLGIKITAEGVEYKEQLDFLENLNCDDIQGFYFSKPLMLADFSAKLTENN